MKPPTQKPNLPFFREEVLTAKQQEWLGEILLARPIAFSVLGALSLAVAIAAIVLLIYGEYTRKERVVGQITLDNGLAKIYSPVAGTVTKRLVDAGNHVQNGQALYVISTERISTAKGNTQAAIIEQFNARRASLTTELDKQRLILQQEEAALKQRIQDSLQELTQIKQEMATQQDRYAANSKNLQAVRTLASQGMVSQSALLDKEQDNLSLRAQLQTLQRSHTTLQKEISSLQADLHNAPLKAANQLAAIERNIAEIDQQSADTEAHREITIPAGIDGVVAATLAETGQVIDVNAPLLILLPQGSKFEAKLFIPSRAIGFLRKGNQVLLRYQAFPYQKFGQYVGHVSDISRTALSPAELQLLGAVTETLYRVTVALDSQTVMAYGQPLPLQDGMQLEADVLLETRKLYEWLLEPVYSLTGTYGIETEKK